MRRLIQPMLAVLLGVFVLPSATYAADSVSVHAILITASKGKGGSDPRLADYEATLRRTLPFDSFKFAGEGSASVSGGGRATVSLGGGHRLELSSGDRAGSGVKVRVQWTNGGREVLSTSLTLQPGVPAVLGRGGEGEVPVILLIAK